MKDAVAAYLTLRRAAGFEMANAEYLLDSFARFAAERNETRVYTQSAIDWAARGPSAAQRDKRLKAICRFARYLRVEDDRHELPPANYFGCCKPRRMPYIYSSNEISRLLEAAGRLRPRGAMRAETYTTLIALLASTGLRISEALGLKFADITDDGLLIRETKFRKTRLVPLHDTAAAGLRHYLIRRRQLSAGDDHVFVGGHGRRLPYSAVHCTFKTLLKAADVWPAPGRHRPRLHDMRHAFAVRALQTSPAGRPRTGQHMVALATYMGHVNIYATYWYLEATADLLSDIAGAGEAFMAGGAQP
nr:tyrosine-type recombinase/integrase [uncultured Rhodopila sp.]